MKKKSLLYNQRYALKRKDVLFCLVTKKKVLFSDYLCVLEWFLLCPLITQRYMDFQNSPLEVH